MEIEQEVEHNKKEWTFKGLLMEIKTREEDMQQMDDKKISFKVFQLVVPLLKAQKQENQIKFDGIKIWYCIPYVWTE